MARTPKTPVNAEMLLWARQISGYDIETVARRIGVKPEKLAAWEHSEDQPSLAQLRALSDLFRRTPASFFLVTPPATDLPHPPDFRGDAGGDLSPELRREMRKMALRRRAFLELAGPSNHSISSQSYDLSGDVEGAATRVREQLGITLADQWNASDAGQALKHWIHVIEDQGVLVFQMSRIPLSECRGFSIYEAEYPVICLNGADSVEARNFTLLHELGHVLLRSGSVCTLWVRGEIERQCNAFAAEALMPRQAFLDLLGNDDPVESIPELAKQFRVSQEATAVRLRILNRISEEKLQEIRRDIARAVQERRDRESEIKREGGPPHYKTHLRNLGEHYVSSVLDAYYSERISLTDAAHILESKVSTIERMEQELREHGSAL